MKLFKIAVSTAALLGLAACHPNTGASTSTDTVATVNGTPVSREMLNTFLKGANQGKDPGTLTQAQKDQALDNLVKAELVVQQADKDGVLKDSQTQALLEIARLNAVQQAFGERFVKENKPTDEELKKEYDAQVAALPHTEYHAAHILVPTADSATALIAELGKGAKFEDLARKNSTDSSKEQGGDLGWQTPERMVKPFSDAMISLKPGEYTKVPVQTQYGFHVIKLVETRPLTPPTFDAVKDRVEQIVLGKKFKTYLDGLQAKAQIDKKI